MNPLAHPGRVRRRAPSWPLALALACLAFAGTTGALGGAGYVDSVSMPAPGWVAYRFHAEAYTEIIIRIGLQTDEPGYELENVGGLSFREVLAGPWTPSRATGFGGGQAYRNTVVDVHLDGQPDRRVEVTNDPVPDWQMNNDAWVTIRYINQEAATWRFVIAAGAHAKGPVTFLTDVTTTPGVTLLGKTSGPTAEFLSIEWDTDPQASVKAVSPVVNQRYDAFGKFAWNTTNRAYYSTTLNDCLCRFSGPEAGPGVGTPIADGWVLRRSAQLVLNGEPGHRSIEYMLQGGPVVDPTSGLGPDGGFGLNTDSILAADVRLP